MTRKEIKNDGNLRMRNEKEMKKKLMFSCFVE